MIPYPQGKLALRAAVACCTLLWGSPAWAAQKWPSCNTADRRGTLIEAVADHSTRVPLAGALVIVSWRDGSVRARTDSTGKARICAPADKILRVQASYGDANATSQTVVISDQVVNHSSLVDAAGFLVRGRVIDQETGTPVPQVSVSFANTGVSTLTDQEGRFLIPRLPVGSYQLIVEHIAYATNRAALSVQHEDLDALVRLTPTAIPLQPIVVTAFSRRLEHVGFYDREKRGVGTFINRRQIDAMNVHAASELLRRVPGVRLVPQTRRPTGQQRNATVGGRGGNCRYVFIIDGARTLPDFEMDYVTAASIEGVEIYNGMAEVPAQFKTSVTSVSGSTICGVVAVWMRNSR